MTFYNPVALIAVLMAVTVHIILGVPRRGGSWLFAMSRYLVEQTIRHTIGHGAVVPAFLLRLLKWIPDDIRSATDKFNLEAKATVYAVCPKCHSTWKPSPSPDHVRSYPKICKYSRYGSKCKQQLTRPRKIDGITFHVPIKQYISYDFEDWMAALLARPGF